MNIRFSRSMLIYFAFVTLFTLSCISYGAYYTWSNGSSDFNKISSVYKANVYYDELVSGEDIKSIKTDVTSDGIRNALKRMEQLYTKVERVNLLTDTDEFNTFSKKYKQSRKEMLKVISYPEVSSIVGVLNRKITSFNIFVTENNWRTLTRMSQRLKVKTSSSGKKNSYFYRYKKLKSTYKFIQDYQTKMIAITNGSVLSIENKNAIVSLLQKLDVELQMFKGFLDHYKNLSENVSDMSMSYSKWIDQARPELAKMKLNVESSSKSFYIGLGVFIASLTLLMLGGIKVHSKSISENQKVLESGLLKLVRDGLIPFESNLKITGSESFKDEFSRYKDYFHKRMSFGAIFQDAVPFPSILLDSNLNLVWANKLFYEDWKVSNVNDNENTVTWDYLQKFTNLGEDDPVFSAINQGLAGIYQIQLKLQDSDSPTPFEMYVTPISYLGQKRVMIFFYPLGSLEETLGNQRKSMVGPVLKSLDSMINDSFDEEFIEKVQSDFDAAGIPQVYEKFLSYNEQKIFERNTLQSDIESLQDNITKSDNSFSVLSKKVDFITENHSDQQSAFEDFKTNIISLSGINSNLKIIFENVFSNVGTIIASKGNISKGVGQLNETLAQNKKILDSINTDKSMIKEFKTELDSLKFSFRKKSSSQNSSNESLKEFFKQLDATLERFSKTLGHLDITISKANLIMEQESEIDQKSLFSEIENLDKNYSDNLSQFSTNFKNLQQNEDALITSLKSSFDNYKNQKGEITEIGTILATQFAMDDVIENNVNI